ncbi:hypothetical protein [Ralstonia solanacearum]|uniref:hypothetical protein n=1 Tax=Ralstonia solanacearum TaxID=305 RepID=UPI001E4158B9|nr:hypothetical protein [Ralstonia solanacearum]
MDSQKVIPPTKPKVVVRRSSKRVVVTAVMKESLRTNAKASKCDVFPELPEWRIER